MRGVPVKRFCLKGALTWVSLSRSLSRVSC
jgi:hypothetical protein